MPSHLNQNSSTQHRRISAAIDKARSALKRGDNDIAIETLMSAVRALPTSAQLWFALGDTCAKLKRLEGAVAAIRQACVIEPQNARYRIALADAFFLSDARELALSEYIRAAELDPTNATAWANAGAIHQQLGNPEEALGALRNALAIDPNHAIALNNSGLAFCEIGDFTLAHECLKLAVKAKPDYEDAKWNATILDLLHGDYARGWEGHEQRFVQLEKLGPLRSFPEKRWNGERFDGKRLLIWPEQGLGDQLQFARFIPRVKQLGGTVVLACAEPLRELFRHSIPEADEIVVIDTPYEQCDLQVPLMSLPYVLKLSAQLDSERIPYIHTTNAVPASIHAALPTEPQRRLRVGVVWAGQPKHRNDRNRSIDLDLFESLFGDTRIEWVSLQKGELAEARLAALNMKREAEGIESVRGLGAQFTSFTDTAHAIERLDLVITVDTSVAHLAGAMGVPCWVLLPFNPDWRWQLYREDSPWYETVRLFRQSERNDWSAVIDNVASELGILATDSAEHTRAAA